MNKENKLFFKSCSTEWVDLGSGVKRQIMGYDENLMLVRVSFEEGSIGAVHDHVHVQTSSVVSGRFEVTIDGETQILSPGDGFFAPSGKPHGVVCLEAGIIIDVFHPIRKEFIQLGIMNY